MGNHSSHEHGTPKKSMSRTSSGADIQEKKYTAQLVPIEKLAKLLAQQSAHGGGGSNNTITSRAFVKLLFSQYPELGSLLFAHLLRSSGGNGNASYISLSAFRQQAERFLSVLTDERTVEVYLKVFANGADDINQDQLFQLLMVTYRLAMDHYPGGPQTCLHVRDTLRAVVDSAFHKKQHVSVGYAATWILQNIPRLTPLLHRYVVHILTTAHRALESHQNVESSSPGLELSTPVLEKSFDFNSKIPPPLLPVSQVWLLATCLPPLFTHPVEHLNGSPPPGGLAACSAQSLVSKILGATYPSHWALLYNSNQHGMGANRFMHHVLSYRGPTLTFLRGEQGTEFCLAASTEWHESNHYWGTDECHALQILPLFHVIESGPKLLYLNMSIRGYPKGVRAGRNPSKPAISVNEAFNMVEYSGIPYSLHSVEVWGCGNTQQRERQLEIKKWQVKQAEQQRVVKISAADWADHPDRYLLEMGGGRQSYSVPPPS